MEERHVPGEGLRELGVGKGGDVEGRGGPSVEGLVLLPVLFASRAAWLLERERKY